MKYNPNQHHRQSIRLPGYDYTSSGAYFITIASHHMHGILVLTNPPGRGAALGQGLENLTEDSYSNATPTSNPSEPGVALGQKFVNKPKKQLPNAVPLPPRLISGSVGAIVLNFKSVTTRSRNRIHRSPGIPRWQRNDYEHIIRNDEALHQFR